MKIKIAAKLAFTVSVFLTIPVITYAQKNLPNIQQAGLRAPGNVKIDGQAEEWGELQAYNKATDIAYTISNNDEKLYLVVQAKYREIVDKVLRGGITLIINHSLKKRDEKPISITYPVLRDADMSVVTNKFAGKTNAFRENKGAAVKVDDLNELLQSKDKVINITGISAIPDSSISVYNAEGIKVASKFDDHLIYTCEIAIPLKFLSNNGANAFSYQIKINEAADMHRPIHIDGNTPPPPPPVMIGTLAATDFWGEYTLAKK